jgi:hypothetical protein
MKCKQANYFFTLQANYYFINPKATGEKLADLLNLKKAHQFECKSGLWKVHQDTA